MHLSIALPVRVPPNRFATQKHNAKSDADKAKSSYETAKTEAEACYAAAEKALAGICPVEVRPIAEFS